MSTHDLLHPWRSQFARAWDKLRGSVGRPKPGEVAIFERFAQKWLSNGATDVTVLGATPELRTFLSGYPVRVRLVDACPEMIEAMTEMMADETNPREEALVANWLDDPLPPESCDVVLGDLVLSNMPFDAHQRFLANVSKWLKPGGAFITRIESFKPVHRTFSYEELFALVAGRPLTWETIGAFWDGAWLVGPMYTRPIVIQEFYDGVIAELNRHPRLPIQSILDRGGIVFPLDKVWYSYSEPELLALLQRRFSIEDEAYDDATEPVYRDFTRIYALVKAR